MLANSVVAFNHNYQNVFQPILGWASMPKELLEKILSYILNSDLSKYGGYISTCVSINSVAWSSQLLAKKFVLFEIKTFCQANKDKKLMREDGYDSEYQYYIETPYKDLLNTVDKSLSSLVIIEVVNDPEIAYQTAQKIEKKLTRKKLLEKINQLPEDNNKFKILENRACEDLAFAIQIAKEISGEEISEKAFFEIAKTIAKESPKEALKIISNPFYSKQPIDNVLKLYEL